MSNLAKELRIMAGMITMCERISFGSDSALMEKAADEIERLQRMKSELRATMANQQDLIDALENSQERMERKNSELKAQVERLKHRAIDLLNIDDIEDEEDAAAIHENMNDAVLATPAQCLAEIMALAGKDGYEAGWDDAIRCIDKDPVIYSNSDDYADQLSQQAKKCGT